MSTTRCPTTCGLETLWSPGDLEGALDALASASEKQLASAYAADAATYRAAALAAAGMDSQTANVLAAATMGTAEYADLYALGEELLQYGEQYEAAGDLASAQKIYEAVYGMGGQLEKGAESALERLAGLDLQRETVGFLEGIYVALDAQPQLEWLSNQVGILLRSIESLAEIFNAISAAFNDIEGDAEAAETAEEILEAGDVAAAEKAFL